MDDFFALGLELHQRGEPFVMATVVRCERPTSAKPGSKALIRKDGTLSGWVGGACAEPVVIREAMKALLDGQPRLLALTGEGNVEMREGMLEYPMRCHSGGTLEIYLEPVLPKPELCLFGRGPVVETLAKLGKAMEFNVLQASSQADVDRLSQRRFTRRSFIVVASHGTFDEEALTQALWSEVGYVSLVASRKRAAAVVESLRKSGVPADRLGRLKAPAGLDIGAVTPEEIAVSILAEIIQMTRSQKVEWKETPIDDAGDGKMKDPVCGMSVEAASARYHSRASGRSYYFCCLNCKEVFDQGPARYALDLTS